MSGRRVVIVGGGVIGLCVADRLARSGRQVTVVERGAPECGGNSPGNAGMVVPSHFVPLAAPGVVGQGLRWMLDRESPFHVRPRPSLDLLRWGWLFIRHANRKHVLESRGLLRDLGLESRRLFTGLAAEMDFGLEPRGLLMLCRSAEGLDEEAELAGQAAEIGVEARVLDARETAELDPDVRMEVAGSVYFPQDCHLDPGRFLAGLRERIRGAGGEIVGGVEVDGVERVAGRVTAVSGGGRTFSGDQFVIAGGVWSPRLVRGLGLRLPMQAGKGYSLTLAEPVQTPGLCSILTEARVAVTPMGGRLRFAGTMEICGLGMESDPRRVRGIVRSVPRYFPEFREEDFSHTRPWVGLRPVSPDGLPYLGFAPGCGNLVVAAGHGMLGLSLGPVTGELVGEMLEGKRTSVEIGRLGVGRFG